MFSAELLSNSFALEINNAIISEIAMHILMRETRYHMNKTLQDLIQQRNTTNEMEKENKT